MIDGCFSNAKTTNARFYTFVLDLIAKPPSFILRVKALAKTAPEVYSGPHCDDARQTPAFVNVKAAWQALDA